MKTLINIRADREVKERAQKVAAELGIPLSTIINAYLRQLIQTREVRFVAEGKLKSAAKRRLDRLAKEARGGKNLVGPFSSAEEMDAYLNSLEK